jgi:tellurite methyltransferase
MNPDERAAWEERHRGRDVPGEPEPFLIEMLPLMPRGLALDVAAGRGRHSLVLARAGIRVAALDYSETGLRSLLNSARPQGLPIWPVVADAMNFPLGRERYDLIVNVNFLERELFAAFKTALRAGGMLLVDTFLVDQAALGHPRDPRYLLGRYELTELLAGLEILRYREGIVTYPNGTRAARAAALGLRRNR